MEENIDALKRLLKNESPLLFLGAGFSIGANLPREVAFPKGNDLKLIVIEKFLKLCEGDSEYDEIKSYTLSKVCQYARNERSAIHLNDFISDYLKNAKPNKFHEKLTSYNWRKIYTTNIDDIVENIYKSQNLDLLIQNFSRKSTLDKKCTEYLKLHGCVNNPSEGIVFSTDEYVDSMTRPKDYRFNNLCLDMNSEDFIFVGSEFEEINIDYYLKLYENSGYKSSKGKLFFINPSPSLFLKSKVKKVGGYIIEWSTEEFLNFLYDFNKIPNSSKAIKKIELIKSGFEFIEKNKGSQSTYDSNLYFGYEPIWEDLFYDWDFLNENLMMEFGKFRRFIDDKESGIFSICGKAFSGKSVFIRRLAIELLNEDYEVHYFKGRYFNYYPYYQHITNSDSNYFALIMDDASYHYKAIKQLSRFKFSGKKLIIVSSSRPFYHFRKRYHFIEENFIEFSIDTQISKKYAKTIVNKLEEKGYLGELKKFEDDIDKIEQIKSRSDIFSLLSYITHGSGFKDRMLQEIVPIVKTNPQVNDLLLKTAIFEELDLPYFPKELVTYLYTDKTSHVLSLADDFLKFNSKGDIQFRAKFYAKNLIKINGKNKIIEAIKDILIFISPQISESNQRAGNSYWCEIQEALTKQRLLKNIFGLTKVEIKSLLHGIQNYYGNNSHFWLQLGISEQSLTEFEKALNHFKQAEALNQNSYIIRHAIGRNYMKHANSLDSNLLAASYHDEGVAILLPLIEHQEEYSARAFSTHSYLNEELIYIEKFDIKVSNAHLRKLFSYLRKMIDKDPEDVMSKHMSNHFYKFLQRTNKLNVININFRDLSDFKSFFQDYNVSIDELLEEQDFN